MEMAMVVGLQEGIAWFISSVNYEIEQYQLISQVGQS